MRSTLSRNRPMDADATQALHRGELITHEALRARRTLTGIGRAASHQIGPHAHLRTNAARTSGRAALAAREPMAGHGLPGVRQMEDDQSMSTPLSLGVYVVETPGGPRAIEDALTAVTIFVGEAERCVVGAKSSGTRTRDCNLVQPGCDRLGCKACASGWSTTTRRSTGHGFVSTRQRAVSALSLPVALSPASRRASTAVTACGRRSRISRPSSPNVCTCPRSLDQKKPGFSSLKWSSYLVADNA